MDVLLEKAEKGREINYSIIRLPLVRVVKGWCMLNNFFGKPAIIPEGMSATQALKNQFFVAMYVKLSNATKLLADQFIIEKHYKPPYWQLVNLARKANQEMKAD